MFNTAAWTRHGNGGGTGGPMTFVRKVVVLAFAVIQLILVTRILLEIGVVPADWGVSPSVVTWSDALAAPVSGIGSGLGDLFGGEGIPGIGPALGDGLNPLMIAALAGWTVVEGLVLRVVRKFASV